jgi:hypothetical protein
VRLEGLGQLGKKIHLIGTRTRDLLACSIVPQPTTRLFIISWVGLSPLRTATTSGLLYKPQMIDVGDCGATGGIKIGRENRSTRRKPAPAPLCPHQLRYRMTLFISSPYQISRVCLQQFINYRCQNSSEIFPSTAMLLFHILHKNGLYKFHILRKSISIRTSGLPSQWRYHTSFARSPCCYN